MKSDFLTNMAPENRLKTVCIRVDRSTGYDNLFTCFVEDNTVL